MRVLCLLLCITLMSFISNAQYLTKERPLRFHLYGTYSIPVGSSASSKNNELIFGDIIEGGGGGISLSIPVKDIIDVGIGIRTIEYKFNGEEVNQQVMDYFKTPGYVNSTDQTYIFSTTVFHSMGAEFSKVIKTPFIEVEPSLRLGLISWAGEEHRFIKIHQYNLEDKDVEFINVTSNNKPSSVYYSAGVRLNKWMFKKHVSLSAALFYRATGNMNFRFDVERVDFYRNVQPLPDMLLKQSFTNIDMELGIQLPLWKGMMDQAQDRKAPSLH